MGIWDYMNSLAGAGWSSGAPQANAGSLLSPGGIGNLGSPTGFLSSLGGSGYSTGQRRYTDGIPLSQGPGSLGSSTGFLPTGGGIPQFPRLGGNFADFLKGFNPRALSGKTPMPQGSFSPFSIGGVPQFFNPATLGALQGPAPIRAQSWADRSGTLNTGLGDMFGGGRMRPQAYTPNPYIQRMMPQRTSTPNLPNLPPMNWGGGYNGGF